MGKEGRAFTLVGYDERGLIRAIQYEANVQMQEIRLDTKPFENMEILNHLSESRAFSRQGGGTLERKPHGGGFRGGFNRNRYQGEHGEGSHGDFRTYGADNSNRRRRGFRPRSSTY